MAVTDKRQKYAGENCHLAYDFWIPNRRVEGLRSFHLNNLESCNIAAMSIGDYNVKEIVYDIEQFRKVFMQSIEKIVECYTLLPGWDQDLLTRFGPVIYYM